MTDFIVKFFETVRPFMLAFGPMTIVLWGFCLFFILLISLMMNLNVVCAIILTDCILVK